MRLGIVSILVLATSLSAPAASHPKGKAKSAAADLEGREAEVDADGDGKTDVWRSFGEAGRLTEARYDTTGDGKPDVWVTFGREGSQRLIDENGDGEPERRVREEFAPGGKNGTRVIRTYEERRSGKDWRVERTTEYLPGKDLLKITDVSEQGKESVSYDVANVEEDSYWERYEACFEAQGRNCDRELRARRTQLTTDLARVISTAAGDLRCETDAEVFLGNGVVVDRASCGARPAGSCPESGSHTCPASLPTDAGGPVVVWCDSCHAEGSSAQGCYTCRGRDDVVTQVASQYSAGVARLLACFNPSSSHPGPYPHRGLFNEVVSTMGDLMASGGTGVRLSCPSDDLETNGQGPAGQANAAEGTIEIFDAGVDSAAVIGHEFLHLTSRGGGGIDDHNHATHNHPRDTHSWEVDAEHHETRSESTNDGELPNRYFDRVYGCQFLCFEGSDFVSKEQCETCMGYSGGGRNAKRPCRDLMSREDLGRVHRVLETVQQEVGLACGRQYWAARRYYRNVIRHQDITVDNDYLYVPDLAAAERERDRGNSTYITYHLSLEPPSSSDPGQHQFDGIDGDTRRDYGEIRAACEGALRNVGTALDDVLAGSAASDPRNRNEILSLKREFAFREAKFGMRKACSEIGLYGFARGNCIRRRGAYTCEQFFDRGGDSRYFFTQKLTPRIETLNEKIAAWNTLAAVPEADLRPGFNGAVWTGQAIDAVPTTGDTLTAALERCRHIPVGPAMDYPEGEVIEVRGH